MLYRRFIGISLTRKLLALQLVLLLALYPYQIVFASYGGNGLFYCEPLNGHYVDAENKIGENEIKLMVDTDGAQINHLIFDLLDDSTYDINGNGSDPIDFPLHNNNVLGTETPFTSVSGDYAYDLASANPTKLSNGSNDIHFATLIADQGDYDGLGGYIAYDTDTAIYVNAQREGDDDFDCAYTVAANQPPVINSPAVDSVDLSTSKIAPSAIDPLPITLVQEVSVNPTFTYSVTDITDASVRRRMSVYKRLDDGSWNYSSNTSASANYARSGTDMDFSESASLDYASYYKVVFKAIDDQGAYDEETFYFSTVPDTEPPDPVPRAFMTFISDSNNRNDVISQISFVRTTDNDAIDSYYIWSHEYLVDKDIINKDGTYDLDLDTSGDDVVSEQEFYVALRALVDAGNYVSTTTEAEAISSPYFRITGNDVDKVDGLNYLVIESVMEDIFYVVPADTATTILGVPVPNFGDFIIVNKTGDVFGAEVSLSVQNETVDYITGEGSLDVWDSIYLYRNIIGRNDQYPVLVPDMIYSNPYVYPNELSISSSTVN